MELSSKTNHYKLSLKAYLTKSSIIHIMIVASFLIVGLIFKNQLASVRKHNIKLLERSIRVDMVAMPAATMQELKTLPIKENKPAPTEVKSKSTVKAVVINKNDVVFEKKVKKKNFMDMLQDVKKKNKLKKVKRPKIGIKSGRGKKEIDEYKKLVLMGNQLSKGNSAHGETNADEIGALNLYAEKLLQNLRPLWTLPAYLKDKDLKCRIQIYISKSGKLLRAKIYESSSNEEYDSRALSIVRKAAPFPRLPNEIIKNGINGDIILGFPI